jgi:carboxyl-terminal processing protease
VSDIFLNGGAIAATRGRHPGSNQVFAADAGDLGRDLPLVVLINGNSASAAEIVAAALQDNGRAIVVGTNSFGKGTVQRVLRLPNNGEMTLTWSRFLAPSGYRLHELGVLPSVCTHGGGDTKSADTLVPAVQHGQDVLAGRLNTWRATGNNDGADREGLRELCPSDGGTPDVDLALAKAIIADAALYRSLLQEAETTVAER